MRPKPGSSHVQVQIQGKGCHVLLEKMFYSSVLHRKKEGRLTLILRISVKVNTPCALQVALYYTLWPTDQAISVVGHYANHTKRIQVALYNYS